MKWKSWEIALAASLLLTFLLGFTVSKEQTGLSDKMIRLHVVANSDTPLDQSRKLLVRDAVLQTVTPLLESQKDRANCEKVLRPYLPTLEKTAEKVLAANGNREKVSVTLATESFPTRKYDSFTLPAGYYTSLRVVIGNGEGHNWWCVVFPPLCTEAATAEDFRTMGLSREESRWITEDSQEAVFRFKLLEWIQGMRNALLDR